MNKVEPQTGPTLAPGAQALAAAAARRPVTVGPPPDLPPPSEPQRSPAPRAAEPITRSPLVAQYLAKMGLGSRATPPAAPASPPPAQTAEVTPAPVPVETKALVPMFSAVPRPRLVLIEPPTGQEFFLERPSLVVGRTPDNDIVLNFKSLSRHHAEIVRDGDRYFVMDLKSANGVRVNGAACKRVPLRSGDVIKLGHVRLRFDRGEARPPRADARLRLGSVRARLVLGAAAMAVVTVVMVAGRMKRETAPPAPASSASTASSSSSPPPAPVAVAPAGTETAAGLLLQAREAFQQRRWEDALALEKRAAVLSPAAPELAQLRHATENEQQNASSLEALKKVLERRDYASVLKGVSAIADDSVYRDAARNLARTARGKLVAQHLATAERRRAEGDCGEARKEAEEALALESDSEPARDLIARCSRRASARTAAPSGRPAGGTRSASSAVRASARLASSRSTASAVVSTPAQAPSPVLNVTVRPEAVKPHRLPIDSRDPYANDRP
jgi:hypothetical protein